MPGKLARLPWDLAQDQFDTQGADFIAIFGRVLWRHAQDQMRSHVVDIAKEFERLGGPVAKDQFGAVAKAPPNDAP